jgi:hypothetical protein
MAQKMREGRLDPGVRGWAIAALKDAGIDGRAGQSVRKQAEAILEAFRKVTTYAPDPYGAEYIPSAAATLCLRPNLCVNGEDCDGLSVALGSLMLSIGIPTQIVKQTFGGDAQEHVLIAIYDGSNWLYADPSTRLPLGGSVPAADEIWIDPMGAVGPLPEAQPEIITLGKPRHGFGSVLGYPTTSDAHQLLDAAIYNAGQLKLAWDNCNSCTGASSTACGWPDPGTTNIAARRRVESVAGRLRVHDYGPQRARGAVELRERDERTLARLVELRSRRVGSDPRHHRPPDRSRWALPRFGNQLRLPDVPQ